MPVPVFFNELQLGFKPMYEWAFGERIDHPETTARAESIVGALREAPGFEIREPPAIPPTALGRTHAFELITLYNAARELPEGQTFYPTVFPKPSQTRGDPSNVWHAGAWCFDAGTPLDANTAIAATWSAACAREAAVTLLEGKHQLTYSLSRPPGHHATRDLFGGYCYYNNAAIAARHLRRKGRVAVLDIDFHHGNGTQSIFWRDPRVLVMSIHGDPREFFPFFAGHPEEIGGGRGRGFNQNLPLPRGCDGKEYLRVLDTQVAPAMRSYAPEFLVLSAGLDAYHKDPIGHFALDTDDFRRVGERIGRMGLPTVAVQEGGYYTPDLGRNARALLEGLVEGQRQAAAV